MIDKHVLYARLDQMLELPEDWDGFGTFPITQNVHKIAVRLVEYLDPNIDSCKVFVGVNTPGTAYIEISRTSKQYEFTIATDGTVWFEEILAGREVGSGMFLLSKKKLAEVLSQ